VRRISWYAYVYHRPSMHVLANGGPAQALRPRRVIVLRAIIEHSLGEV